MGEGPSREERESGEVRLGGKGYWKVGLLSSGSEYKANRRGLGADGGR
jgi:hypothetical protein